MARRAVRVGRIALTRPVLERSGETVLAGLAAIRRRRRAALSRPSRTSLAFAAWLLCLFLLNGALLGEPVAASLLARLAVHDRLQTALKPLFTAAYQQ
jgi:hypothetical protein